MLKVMIVPTILILLGYTAATIQVPEQPTNLLAFQWVVIVALAGGLIYVYKEKTRCEADNKKDLRELIDRDHSMLLEANKTQTALTQALTAVRETGEATNDLVSGMASIGQRTRKPTTNRSRGTT